MPRLLKSNALFIAIVVAVLATPLLFVSDDNKSSDLPESGLPWQIDVRADGTTRVFGLTPGLSTLGDALQRFGPPAERVRHGEYTEHFLYPEKGLDLRLDAKGKEVLQYVAPHEFSRVRDPLFAVQ